MENLLLLVLVGWSVAFVAFATYRCAAVWRVLRTRDPFAAPGAGPLTRRPQITIQIPIYNEGWVVRDSLAAVAALSYPAHLLEVHILDDSTDFTRDVIEDCSVFFARRGIAVRILRRSVRTGYKAGALQAAAPLAHGEFVLLLDADFAPPADFIDRLLPPLLADPGLALTQARWTFTNDYASRFTMAQSGIINAHFVLDQIARQQADCWINFNGSGGLWRRSAIESCGGWSADTLTEDVDLSYRVQLAGWRLAYLRDVQVAGELAPYFSIYQAQFLRWTQGMTQCAVKFTGPVLRSRASLGRRFEALNHFWNSAVFPAWIAALCGLALSLLLADPGGAWVRSLHQLAGLAFGSLLISNAAYYGMAIKALNRDWRRRLLQLPRLFLMGSALAASSTIAIVRGLRGGPVEFNRTNKYGGAGVCPYVLPQAAWSVRVLEIGLLFIAGLGLGAAFQTGVYGATPYFAWTGAAMIYAMASRFTEQRRERRREILSAPGRRTEPPESAPDLAEPAASLARRIA